MALVKTVMKRKLVTAAPDEPVARAAQRMTDRRLGSLLVMAEDELIGIISERDLVRRVLVPGADPEATPRQQILPVAYALSLVPGSTIKTAVVSPPSA